MYRYGELDDDRLKESLLRGTRVLCGGRHREPLFWMRTTNKLGPTCGRTAPQTELEQHDITRSNKRKVYFCSRCRPRFV